MKSFNVPDYGVVSDPSLLQTSQIQTVFDLCREEGGAVIFPKGTYLTGGLMMYSHMTIRLLDGARILGSTECTDYPIFDLPQGTVSRNYIEVILSYYIRQKSDPERLAYLRRTSRRAILSAYCAQDIAVIGEGSCFIDGRNVYDGMGEENYRGPHGLYFTHCRHITLRGYTIQHCGNLLHAMDDCEGITMSRVTCLGGSDGIHLDFVRGAQIDHCVFRTGDDCIGCTNVEHLHVSDCVFNTSCQFCRMGGKHILIERCHMYGPGYYPHRMTVVKSKTECLPRECGRHNTISMLEYFASDIFPADWAGDMVWRDCLIENADMVMHYEPGTLLQTGTYLRDITFENVTFTGLDHPSVICVPEDHPLNIRYDNVKFSFRSDAADPSRL